MQFVVGEFEQANAEHCVWLSRSRRQCSLRKVGLIADVSMAAIKKENAQMQALMPMHTRDMQL